MSTVTSQIAEIRGMHGRGFLLSVLLIISLVILFNVPSSQAQESKELLRPKEMSVKLDKELGAPALRIGAGREPIWSVINAAFRAPRMNRSREPMNAS